MAAPSQARSLISPRFSIESSSQPADFPSSQQAYIDEVKSRLNDGRYKLENFPCPCGEKVGVVISEIDRYGLPLTFLLCSACGTLRIDPYLDKTSLEAFYTHFYQKMYGRATDVGSYFVDQGRYGQKVLKAVQAWFKPGSRIYEIGCGAGGALDVFQRSGYQVAGCDYSAELIAAGTERGVKNLVCGALKDIQTRLPDAKADLIYLTHVFEHMNDPLGFLEECRPSLAPGGRIVIIVPDVSRIDSFACPAGDLFVFLHIAHKYNFSFEGLSRLGRRAGYQVRRLTPDESMQTSHSHAPELWLELAMNEAAESQPEAVAKGDHGERMLKYLKRTEKMYSAGLCRGQLLPKLQSARNSIENNLTRVRRLTPAKVMRKIRGAS